MIKEFDSSQKKVIEAEGGYFLVLAPPGCGKTELLTQRLLRARQDGLDYEKMLCLTFTNRAARGMRERIGKESPDACEGLFVGNIHRFCTRYLYENQILPMSVGIIDELDQKDILDEFGFTKFNETRRGFENQLQVADIGRLAARLYQEEHHHPQDVWLEMPRFKMAEVGRKSEELAEKYYAFKQENGVIDFDDILLMTYSSMMEPGYKTRQYSDYPWIQVDEVQDLNSLQNAIIDKLTAPENFTVMYLGDEQQAIYSFMGAKLAGLNHLAARAGGNILRLDTNYRSPAYLLDTYNIYATTVLGMNGQLLPKAEKLEEVQPGMMTIFDYPDDRCQDDGLVRIVRKVTKKYPDERVGILLRTNKAADRVSALLDGEGIGHFKLSGQDVFKTEEFKTLVAHFSVVLQDTRFFDWARILWKTGAVFSAKDARKLVSRLREAAVSPLDLIEYEGRSSYVAEFLKAYESRELVIFDTETTGLNFFEDDIIQIAAIKVKNGRLVPGSGFNVLIRTDREIPPMLGTEVNPMLAEYAKGPLYEADEAFRMFLDYVGDDDVLGHNVNFDFQILKHNLLRRLGGERIEEHIRRCWDSLKLVRLLEPRLRVYKLKNLLEVFSLEGENSHRADDDIQATRSLVDFCAGRIRACLPRQAALWSDVNVSRAARNLKTRYQALYEHSRAALYDGRRSTGELQWMDEFEAVYENLCGNGHFAPIPNMDYIVAFLRKGVFSPEKEPYFWDQVNAHLSDLRTFTQADLCESGIIQEKVYVMTVHKAKGLEFEHVILFDATDGCFPLFLARTPQEKEEEARVFYVGISRAKKRLSILYPHQVQTRMGPLPKVLTPFLKNIKDRFSTWSQPAAVSR